jgi:hypothetical protein
MSDIGVLAIAIGENHERYDSWHIPPEVNNYIESVLPESIPHEYVDGGKFFKVTTTNSACKLTAAPNVVTPSGEVRAFSYWLIQPDPKQDVITITTRMLDVFVGESGLVGLYYGISRPPMKTPNFDIKDFDRFVAIMMKHFPSWDPTPPQPWKGSQP